jgi:hypothetical protein
MSLLQSLTLQEIVKHMVFSKKGNFIKYFDAMFIIIPTTRYTSKVRDK